MNIDPSTTKYLIQARLEAEGIVEKPDVVGAVFGQTEGLLGEELDLRDLQKSGRIGRIEVDVQSKKGRSEGTILIPSSLDQVETSILAAALETIDRVGPCKATIKVEGRQDVLNLLRSGIKNAIAVEGTNVPKTIQELSKERALTAFVDGDRGGDLILKELLQVAEVDFIARAPRGKEVEELTQKQIMKALRNKIPADQYVEMYGLSGQVYKPESEFPEAKPASPVPPQGRSDRGTEPRPEPRTETRAEAREFREVAPVPLTPTTKVLNPKLEKYREMLVQLGGSSTARLLDEGDAVVTEVPVRELVETLKNAKQTRAVVFDGIITQRILDIAAEMNMHSVVGTTMGTITKQPAGVVVWTRSDLAP